ncbi:hypothetical protein VP501E541_P0095 [Vibrio phage 501E54-1]|nr:hypothetical protein VP501E541_P0095 [Vibrio phage 501E54-1]
MDVMEFSKLDQVGIFLYLVLGCWWIIWVWVRKGTPINLDKFLLVIFFGHFLVGLLLFMFWMVIDLLRDLTPSAFKNWLFKEWK